VLAAALLWGHTAHHVRPIRNGLRTSTAAPVQYMHPYSKEAMKRTCSE
jgi:hypothetical protein